MTEERERYRAGPTDGAEPPLATGAPIVAIRSHRGVGRFSVRPRLRPLALDLCRSIHRRRYTS